MILAGFVPPLLLALVFWGARGQVADPVLRGALLSRDALAFWLGGTLARAGRIATVFDPAAYWSAAQAIFGRGLGLRTWNYPPPMLLVAVPVSLLPVLPAFLAWNVAGAALLWLGLRAAGIGWVATLLALTSPAVMENVLIGQSGLLCAALALPGFVLLDRRPWLAGALLGALILKPQTAVLAPVCLLASRNWRAAVAAALSAASLAAASALAFGWESWAGFAGAVLPFVRHSVLETPWRSGDYQAMMATPFMAARWAGASLGGAYLVQGISAAGAALLCWRAWRDPGADRLARAALTLALTFLTTPYGYCYDMPALTAALIAVTVRDGRWRGGARLLFAVAWIAPGLGTWFSVGHMPPFGLAAATCAAMLACRRLRAGSIVRLPHKIEQAAEECQLGRRCQAL